MKPVAAFLLIAFAFTWAVFGWIYQTGGLGAGTHVVFMLMGAMAGPAIAAIVCTFLFDREQRLSALGLTVPSWKRLALWMPFAVLTPILLSALAIIVTLLVTGTPPADAAAKIEEIVTAQGVDMPMPADTLLMLQFAALPLGILFNAVVLTFTEELGWRGWLQPRLAHFGFWNMCLVIGVIWGIWHAPIILMGYNFPGLGWGGVAAMIVFCVLLTPYHALLRERGAGAWGPGMFHGTINAVAGFSFLFLPEPVWPWNGLLGLGGFGVMAAGCGLIWLYRRNRPLADGLQG